MSEQGLKPAVRYLWNVIGYETFMAVTSGIIVYHARSHTAVFPMIFAVGGVLCFCLMLYTIKAAIKGNTYTYPYGTGRLENLSAILLSVMLVTGALIPFVQAIQSLVNATPRTVNMGWTSLLLLISAFGNLFQTLRARWLLKSQGSPIIESCYHCYLMGFIRDACSFLMIGLCWLFKGGNPFFMARLDSLATIALTIYSLYHFVPQIWGNFRSLADFPVSEENQLKIIGVLARYFDSYEMLGKIYTTNRGQTMVLEVELAFKPGMTVNELIGLENTIRQDFHKLFPGCIFRIIPQVSPAAGDVPAAGKR